MQETHEEFETSQGKSIRELFVEAAWFSLHSALAVAFMIAAEAAFTLTHPSSTDSMPKLIGTALAFFVPLLGGFLIASRSANDIGRYVWISGLLIFVVAAVFVLDLPTGNGQCEHCLALEKLWRTFFSIEHGSGLMAGKGLAFGCWVPLSLFGYAIGAKFGLD